VSETYLLQRALPLSFPQRREPPPPSPPPPPTCTPFTAHISAPYACWHFLHTQFPELCPSPAQGLTAATAAQLARLPIQVHNALTAANRAELIHLWPTDRAQALLNSISSRPGSMWLDAVPYAPSLRLDDQSFQDASRVRMGVRTFSSFGTCWTYSCGHTVENDGVVHALGCNGLSGLVQSCHDETAEVVRKFVGRLGFSSSREGRYCGLAPRTLHSRQVRWDYHCNLRLGPGHVPADVSFIHPLAASYIRSASRTPGHAAALQDAHKRRDNFADHNCPGYASARSHSKP
jgi:hypothetical protein